jgi:hypothetical protein
VVSGILLEGVSGAGKTKILEALRAHPAFPTLLQRGRIYHEDETLGDLLSDLKRPDARPLQLCRRLHRVLQKLQRASEIDGYGYILERFHLTYYGLFPDWGLYEAVDRQLNTLNCRIVLLHINPSHIEQRSLDRVDRQDSEWAKEIIDYFGSREHALQAMALYQKRRRTTGLSLSTLPYLEIETTLMEWPLYAGQIIRFWSEAVVSKDQKVIR